MPGASGRATEQYACSPFQAWLTGQGLAGEAVAGSVVTSTTTRDALADTIGGLVGISAVRCVPDPEHGAVLEVDETDRVLRVTASETAGLSVEMPLGTADPQTLRQVQEMVADHLQGLPVEPVDPTMGLRFAGWQHTVSRNTGAVGQVVRETGATALEREPAEAGDGTGAWVGLRLTSAEVATVERSADRVGCTTDAVYLGAWHHLLSRMADDRTVVWAALDGRRGGVPAATQGQLMSVRAWDGSPGGLVESVRAAQEWLTDTAADPLTWYEVPATRPRYGFQVLPGEERRGDVVLGVPRPPSWAERLLLAPATGPDRTDLMLWHSTERVADDDARELLGTYRRLLAEMQGLLADPSAHWSATLPHEPEAPAADLTESVPLSLWARVLEQARLRPDAVAVRGTGEPVTYEELVRRARNLATTLRQTGLRADDRVVVHLQESPELIVAFLAVLAVGGAYVPVDVGLPESRVEQLVAVSGGRIAISEPRPSGELFGLPATVVPDRTCADEDLPAVAEIPQALAYVLHTTGSTGRPKGVMVTRAGLDAYVAGAVHGYGLGAGDRVISQTSPMFDLSVTSLLVPLAAGATVELVDSRSGVGGLAERIRSVRQIALLKLTPAHLRFLTRMGLGDAGLEVRRIVVGGEQLRADTVRNWLEQFPSCEVVNEYGPTETVVGCTTFTVAGPVGRAAVPVGYAVPGARVAVRGDMRPLETGIEGEIVVGGAGVARGYAGDPRQTAERFVPDPSGPFGARAYRTGDLAVRTVRDGLLFRGRVDRQLSVHGFRVEPAEIEKAIDALPGVVESAVVLLTDPDGQDALVAYVVSRSADDVRIPLRQILPDYLVPSRVEHVDRIPTTRNGKADLAALPVPRWRTAEVPGDDGDLESVVLAVWSEVLATADISRDAKFFEIGGTSFSLVAVNARLRDVLGREIPLTAMFEHPTVRELAAFIRSLDSGGQVGQEPARGRDREAALAGLRQLRRRD